MGKSKSDTKKGESKQVKKPSQAKVVNKFDSMNQIQYFLLVQLWELGYLSSSDLCAGRGFLDKIRQKQGEVMTGDDLLGFYELVAPHICIPNSWYDDM